MKKCGLIIVLTVILLAAVAFLILRLTGSDAGPCAVIYVDGDEYARVPLSAPQTVTVERSGHMNVVEIFPGGVRMQSSDCANQSCVRQGDVTLDNMDMNDLLGFIICLPNGVTVELVK